VDRNAFWWEMMTARLVAYINIIWIVISPDERVVGLQLPTYYSRTSIISISCKYLNGTNTWFNTFTVHCRTRYSISQREHLSGISSDSLATHDALYVLFDWLIDWLIELILIVLIVLIVHAVFYLFKCCIAFCTGPPASAFHPWCSIVSVYFILRFNCYWHLWTCTLNNKF